MSKISDDEDDGDVVKGELLLTRFRRWVAVQPDKKLFTYIDKKGKEIAGYTYDEWSKKTHRLAQWMLTDKSLNLRRGDRVLLVYPPSIDFMIAFFACLIAGIIAVPVYPPNPTKLSKDITQFVSIQKTSGASVAFTSKAYQWGKNVGKLRGLSLFKKKKKDEQWPELKWVATDTISYSLSKCDMKAIDVEDTAFLQFTSGSTSAPKGVTVRHCNLAHNLQLISDALVGSDSLRTPVVVSWLPQYHDMGLIGSWLGALYTGGQGFYISPITFMQRPVMWLELMSKYKCTHTQTPNFALRLTLRRLRALKRKKGDEAPEFDLRSLKHVFNAAEPVSAEDIDAFVAELSSAGLKASAIVPGYGLAEHVVYVCDGGKQRIRVDAKKLECENVICECADDADVPSRTLVGCGVPRSSEVDIRIVKEAEIVTDYIQMPKSSKLCPEDEKEGGRGGCDNTRKTKTRTFELPEDRVGEIWLNSKSKTGGYWGTGATATRECFHAVLDEAAASSTTPSKDGYFRTGDLGFIHKGELFICGRLKDMIIVRGRNCYPQDIERCVEEQGSCIRQGCTAAFSVSKSDGEEEIVVLVEVRDPKRLTQADLDNICRKIRAGIVRDMGVAPQVVVLLKPRTISKTSSGKIQRSKNKQRYLKQRDDLPRLDILTIDRGMSNGGDATKAGDDEEEGEGAATSARKLADVESKSIAAANKVLKARTDLDKVVSKIRNEVAELLESECDDDTVVAVDSVDCDVSLLQLGMASMQIEQLRGVLLQDYDVDVDVQHFFQDSTTIRKVASWTVDGPPPPIAEGDAGLENAEDTKKGEVDGDESAVGPTPKGCCVVS
eukprot:g1284.t1